MTTRNVLVLRIMSVILLLGCCVLAGAQVSEIQKHLRDARLKLTSARMALDSTTSYGASYYENQGKSEEEHPELSTQQINWAFKGEKTRFETINMQRQPDGTFSKISSVDVFDGLKHLTFFTTAEGSTKHTTLVKGNGIERSFEGPLSYGYKLGDEWASDAINEDNFTVVGNSNVATYGQTIELSGTKGKYLPYKVWISPSLGYLIVKTQWVFGRDRITHTVLTVDRVNDVLIPTKFQMNWSIVKDRKLEPYIALTQSVTSAWINEVSDSLFDSPTLCQGDRIKDEGLGAYFEIDSKGHPVRIASIGEQKGSDPATRGFSLAGLVFVVSGATLIGVVVSSVVRPRRKAKTIRVDPGA